ncbi:large ribosomal subunit protein mL48 [Pogoniulus pusillus]|uniref:large ribosomal subunit protein mL48 n=1 Tax=Pogoniulus pusillus TaxID=488313 RepID=UPI0030B9A3AA
MAKKATSIVAWITKSVAMPVPLWRGDKPGANSLPLPCPQALPAPSLRRPGLCERQAAGKRCRSLPGEVSAGGTLGGGCGARGAERGAPGRGPEGAALSGGRGGGAGRAGRMSAALAQVLCLRKEVLLKQLLALSRTAAPREGPLCAAGAAPLSCPRHYRSHPTHGIGRYKYLLPKEAPKKKRVQMREINPGTEHEYGDLNIQLTSHDLCQVELFAQYLHRLCNRLRLRVTESYAMPTKTEEVQFLEERGSKMRLDAVLTTHQRVVQVTGLSSTFAPILLDVIQSSQPEGVHLLVKEHTEADFKSRLKSRPELEELLAQMN